MAEGGSYNSVENERVISGHGGHILVFEFDGENI